MKTFRLSPIIIIAIFTSFLLGSCEKESPTPNSFNGLLKSAVTDYDFSDAETVYGPLKVERATSKPEVLIQEIQIPDYECYEPMYLVDILSGKSDGSNSVSSAIIKINDEVILSQKDFNNKTLYYSAVLELPENFILEVTINGQPADFVTVEIKGIKICFECGSTFIDERDGQVYHTVQIGDQCWMVENLKATKFNDGTAIPLVTDNNAWRSLTSPGYCWYNNDSDTYAETYGALYNGYTLATGKLCPSGWHVPTDQEWTELIDYLGGFSVAGAKLKETGTTHWISPNAGATNESGFTALPGGFRSYNNGNFGYIGNSGYWWSSGSTTNTAWLMSMNYFSSNINKYNLSKQSGVSVRCLMD